MPTTLMEDEFLEILGNDQAPYVLRPSRGARNIPGACPDQAAPTGNPVGVAPRDSLEQVAFGNVLWQQIDLLEPTQGLARIRGVGPLTSSAALEASRGQSYRL